MVQVEIDDKKCTDPRDCRRCLEACPQPGVLMAYPRIGRQLGTTAENWAIMPVLLTNCTACRLCAEVCPQEAITVSIVE